MYVQSIVKSTKVLRLGDHHKIEKRSLFLSLLAKRFDRLSSPTYKNTYTHVPPPNQLHFWTGHIESIIKVKNKV